MVDNTIMGLSLASVLVALTVWVWRVNRSAALVAICHNAIWIAALILVATNLIRYDQATLSAWAVLATALLLFNVGAGLSSLISFRPRRDQAPRLDGAATGSLALMGRRTFSLLFALYMAAFVAYLAVQWARVGDVTLLLNPSALRDIDGVSNLESTPVVIRVVFYLGPVLFAVLAFKEGMHRPLPVLVRIAGVLVIFGTMIALLQRTNVFLSVLIWLALLVTRHFGTRPAVGSGTDSAERTDAGSKRTRAISPTKAVAIAVVGVLLLFGTFQVVAVTLGKNGTQALSTGNVSSTLERSGLTSFFTYFTGGVPAFLQLVDSNDLSRPPVATGNRPVSGEYNPTLWGTATLGPIVRFVPGVEQWTPIEPFIDMGIAINVYTWNGPIYRDFRVAGVAVVMLLAGALISALHANRYRSARFYWLQAALLSGVFLSTFASVTQWGNIMIAFYLSVFVFTSRWRPGWLSKLARRPERAKTENPT
jgi:hypothetical protein